jgi:hypothetical protein
MRVLARVAALIVVAVIAVPGLLACGDKFLVPGRGVRFQPTPKERQRAAVLFYAPASSALARTLAALKTEAALRKVGYRPTLAATPADLARAASTSWDVILVDAAEGGPLRREIPPAGPARLIAVLAQATSVQAAAARAEFPIVLRAPSRNQDFLDALDVAAGRAFADRARALNNR